MPATLTIKRRSSAHSAYWMSNALVPAGLVLIYKYGFAFESLIGLLFVAIGAIGWGIYKQKMNVPLIEHHGEYLKHKPSATQHGVIKMDSSAIFTVRELGLTAETRDEPNSKLEVSRLDFNSNEDWQTFINHLQQQPDITLLFET